MIKNPDTKDLGKRSFVNKLGHLVNGVGQQIPTGTNTICFMLFQKCQQVAPQCMAKL